MRKLAIVGAGVFTLLILLVVSLPFLIPSSAYKQFLEERLETMLGREVTFESDPKIRFFPSIGLRLDGMTIENVEGFSSPNLLEAESLIVSIKLLPLLSRNVEVSSLEFRRAEIFLETDASGTPNWTLPSEASEDEEPESKKETQFDARIPKARLIDSRIVYSNPSADIRYDISEINFIARLEGLDAPFDLSGTFKLNENAFELRSNVSSVQALANGENTQIGLSLESENLSLDYQGSASLSEDITAKGKLSARLTDNGAIRDLFGIPPEQNLPSLGTLTLSGNLSASGQSASMTDLKFLQAGGMIESQFEGDLTYKNTLSANGTLSVETDNVDQLLSALNPEEDESLAPKIARTLSLNARIATDGLGTRIEIHSSRFNQTDFTGEAVISVQDGKPYVSANLAIPTLNLTPQSTAASATELNEAIVWSDEAINLSVLHALDGDFAIDIGRIFRNQSELRNLEFRSNIRSGRLSGKFSALTLANGEVLTDPITARFSATSLPDLSNHVSFSISAETFPVSSVTGLILDEPILYGNGFLDASFISKGFSVSDLVKASSGTFQMSLSNGTLHTHRLQAMLGPAAIASDEQQMIFRLMNQDVTAFESFDLSGRLENGVAVLDTFELDSPVLKARAAGESSIYEQTLSFQMVAYSSGIANQTVAGIQTGDVAIPIRISGTWSAPIIDFDEDFYKALLTTQARDQINKELRNVIDSELEDELDLFIGIATGGRITKPNTPEDQAGSEDTKTEGEDDTPAVIIRDLIFGDRF